MSLAAFKEKPLVKLTASGKVIIRLSKMATEDLRTALESLLELSKLTSKPPLTIHTADMIANRALISEMYTKHYMKLAFIGKETKITLTISEAINLWKFLIMSGMQNNPGTGLMLLQLHQKLG
jgi:hypothetical protein